MALCFDVAERLYNLFGCVILIGIIISLCHSDTSANEPAKSHDGIVPDTDMFIKVVIDEQKLYFIKGQAVISEYPVSTSKYGIGSKSGSNRTPLGNHRVAEKFGKDAPVNTIFKSRANTGKTARINHSPVPVNQDIITSRILWLEGLDDGLNLGRDVDSYKRYIYIHGTADEGLIGVPASHGCIRMRNADVIELFDNVPVGTKVIIQETKNLPDREAD
ncbi:MAG: L,D-transpeptidase [Candidatus Auribacterota bacterium]|jgi:lipoprotein-anchoring transpeptidase ErfK/SrfK|nr:L,D-transpeptidase [Candidatus Auribacterota bacterium]